MSRDAPDEAEHRGDGEGDAAAATDGGEPSSGSAEGDGTTGSLADLEVWRYLRLGAIGLLALLALIATVQLYTNASAAISRWVSPDWVPVFQAAFNLVVLLLALWGLAVLARRRWRGEE